MGVSVRTRGFLLPGNFITDATVCSSHGRSCGHRPSFRPSISYRPHDNPGMNQFNQSKRKETKTKKYF
jgi:hypothetical protein